MEAINVRTNRISLFRGIFIKIRRQRNQWDKQRKKNGTKRSEAKLVLSPISNPDIYNTCIIKADSQ